MENRLKKQIAQYKGMEAAENVLVVDSPGIILEGTSVITVTIYTKTTEKNILNKTVEDSLPSIAYIGVLHHFEECDSLGEVRSSIEPAVRYVQPKVDYAFAGVG